MNVLRPLIVLLSCFFLSLSQAKAQSCVWAKGAGGHIEDIATSVTTDAAGNVYVAGYFQSATITFGTITLTNTDSTTGEIYLVKYDAAGNVLWAKSASGSRDEQALSIATDGGGNVYVTGYFQSPTITFGSVTLTNGTLSAIGYDIFLVKYNSAGAVIWAKNPSGDYGNYAVAVTTDVSGNVYITGYFKSTNVTFGSITVNNSDPSTADIFIAKYDPSGTALWAKSAGSAGDDEATAVATDLSGNVYMTGYFNCTALTFGTVTLTNAGGGASDVFVVKYDASGNVIWAKGVGATGNDGAASVVCDSVGNMYIMGYYSSTTIAFGAATLTHTSGISNDIFIAKYNAAGSAIWAKSVGGSNNEFPTSIDLGKADNIFVTGYFQSPSLSFGAATLTNSASGSSDIFLAKYDTAGNSFWARREGGSYNDYAQSVAAGGDGSVYIAGSFRSTSITLGSTTLTNANGSGFSWDMFVAKYDSAVLSVADVDETQTLSVYPNPASGTITLCGDGLDAISTVRIYDMLGRLVYEVTNIRSLHFSNRSAQIDLPPMNEGIYRLCAIGEMKTVSLSFVVRN